MAGAARSFSSNEHRPSRDCRECGDRCPGVSRAMHRGRLQESLAAAFTLCRYRRPPDEQFRVLPWSRPLEGRARSDGGAPPASPRCHDSPTKSIKLARLRALRADEVHRREDHRWLRRRIARILSIARLDGGLLRFRKWRRNSSIRWIWNRKYSKSPGSISRAVELSGWICEADALRSLKLH